MIHDASLRFSSTTNFATATINSLVAGIAYVPLPTGYPLLGGDPTVWDTQAVQDLGQGRPMLAQFDIKGSFNSSDASITIAFAVSSATVPDFQSDPTNTVLLVAGHPFTLSQLTAGASCTLVIPPMPSLALLFGGVTPVAGRRFLSLGLLANTSITVGNQLLSAGILDAHVMLDVDANEQRMHLLRSGFTA